MSSYIPIASQTLTSSASSVTFSSIPGTFRDLVLVVQASVDGSANLAGRLNNDTGANYNWVTAGGNGSTTVSQSSSGSTSLLFTERDSYASGAVVMHTLQFFDYSQTNKHKSVLSRGARADSGTSMIANRWASTAAVTTITLSPDFGARVFTAGSTFSLYGVSA